MAKENKNYIRGSHKKGNYKYCDPTLSGVYVIINDKTKEFYIGSSMLLNTRLSHHFSDLKGNRHVCERFQNNFNAYGYESYSFYILCNTKSEDYMREKELELLNDNFDNPLLLNTVTINNNWVDERNKDKVIKYKEKLSNAAKKRIGERNSFYGKHHSEETKEKISRVHKGKKPVNQRKVIINDIEYESVAEAARSLEVCNATIIHRIKSGNKLYKDYYYLDEFNC